MSVLHQTDTGFDRRAPLSLSVLVIAGLSALSWALMIALRGIVGRLVACIAAARDDRDQSRARVPVSSATSLSNSFKRRLTSSTRSFVAAVWDVIVAEVS